MNLPPWLHENSYTSLDSSNSQNYSSKRGSAKGFLEKTLHDIVATVHEAFFSEQIALSKGFLQRIDPRVKILALLLLLLTVNILHNFILLWGFYVILLCVSALSGISPRLLGKRVWVIAALFGGIMVLPALFNWVRPGDPLLTLWSFNNPVKLGPWEFPAQINITKQGLLGDFLFITRLGVSVSLATVLTLTTRWNELLRSLRSFFIPNIFIATLEMTYRYIHVFLIVVEEMLLARKARDAGKSSKKEQRHFIASTLGSLFHKSMLMGEEVYFSMLARGYHGEPRSAQQLHFRVLDAFMLAMIIMTSLTLYAADKVLGG